MSRHPSSHRNQLLEDYSEIDLTKLQLQYWRTKGAKQAYSEKTKGLIFRDKREIKRLQDEREELLRSLRVSQSCFNCWTDASVVQDLTAKLACRDRIDDELEAERAKLASLKDQIRKWERKLELQKSGGGNTHRNIKSDKGNLLKRTSLVENKLHRAHKSFNEMMTRNRELREDLKILQVERNQFLHVQSQLKKELHAIQKDIGNLMTKCTEAFNASVSIKERQRLLTDQSVKAVAQNIKERSNLEREMSRFYNFGVFIDLKATERPDSKKVKYKQLESKEQGPEDFEEAVKKILAETEESDLDKLVRNFIQKEQKYALLKFVNYQHKEVETIRRHISQFSNEREIFVAEEQRQHEQRQALMKNISSKQEEIETQLGGYQQSVEGTEKLLDQLKGGVKSLLQISCDRSGICGQLVSSDGSEDENIVEDLRKLENGVSELLTVQSFLHFQEDIDQWDIESLRSIAVQILGMNPSAVKLNTVAATPAPADNTDAVESVLLEAAGPVSRNDLLTLVNKRIQRRKNTD